MRNFLKYLFGEVAGNMLLLGWIISVGLLFAPDDFDLAAYCSIYAIAVIFFCSSAILSRLSIMESRLKLEILKGNMPILQSLMLLNKKDAGSVN